MKSEDKKDEKDSKDDVSIEADETLDDSVVAEEAAGETIKKLREKLKKALEEKQEYLSGWQRAKADLINARRRDDEVKKDFTRFANETLIAELLPAVESFTLAMADRKAWETVDKNWRAGVESIFNQLTKTLSENGLVEVNPLGEKFDSTRDEAIEHVPVENETKSDIIIEVIQKGYSLNGKILRAAKVKVGEFRNNKE